MPAFKCLTLKFTNKPNLQLDNFKYVFYIHLLNLL